MGKIVMTKYNDSTYRIDDINFDKSHVDIPPVDGEP
jgi:hypothetical protein